MNLEQKIQQYITRYAPSEKRLRGYLSKKKMQEVDTYLVESGYDERIMCNLWIETFLSLGKGKKEIIQKLFTKEFPKLLIVERVDAFGERIMDWEAYRPIVMNLVQELLRKSKSLQYIKGELRSRYPYFRDDLEEILQNIDDQSSLEKEVQKYKNRYNIANPIERDKFFLALQRKGFRYSQIQSSIRSIE